MENLMNIALIQKLHYNEPFKSGIVYIRYRFDLH